MSYKVQIHRNEDLSKMWTFNILNIFSTWIFIQKDILVMKIFPLRYTCLHLPDKHCSINAPYQEKVIQRAPLHLADREELARG